MEQKLRYKGFLISLPFWWVMLTAVYLVLQWSHTDFLTFWSAWVGLFVPLGMFNTAASLGTHVWPITFSLILIVVFGGEWLLGKRNMSPLIRIFLILVILFSLTIIVDFIIWHTWGSLEYLKNNGKL